MSEMIYKVFIEKDKNNCITRVESSAFYTLEELNNGIQIDESADGEIYGHAQPNYLLMKYGKTTYDEQFRPNFKYVGGQVISLTDQEKDEWFKPQPSQPSEQELINAQLMREIALLKAGV